LVPLKAMSFLNYQSLDLTYTTSLFAKVGFCVSNELKCAFKLEFHSFFDCL